MSQPVSCPIYFAPLEGVTDAVYRRVHHAHFGGVDKYFIPFISPTQNLVLTPRERNNVSPEVNAGMRVVPQVLTKKADHFLWAAEQLGDMGYEELNLNVGCPSGTVTAKGKGAGMLLDIDALDRFLEEIYAHASARISIKTRIGFFSAEEFDDLLAVYNRYPVHELIIHPRTREQYYKGTPHREVYAACEARTHLPLVYNGDLFTPQDCRSFAAQHPQTQALMLGRGMLANPALAQTAAGGAPLTRESLKAFHDDLFASYQEAYHTSAVLGRMREVAKNIACCFEGADKPLKAARKANSIPVYEDAIARLFGDYTLSANPCFSERS
ncbi:MAG: tRNA-dihydrouridine synthase family protein [Clostridia bacterium]|nr:tRNA-dihydrouridine synthase family protein [Clostridia bacterium]